MPFWPPLPRLDRPSFRLYNSDRFTLGGVSLGACRPPIWPVASLRRRPLALPLLSFATGSAAAHDDLLISDSSISPSDDREPIWNLTGLGRA